MKKMVQQLASQIDPRNQQAISMYGTPAQSKLVHSHFHAGSCQKKDVGEIGEIIMI